jgi:hypothetical protein
MASSSSRNRERARNRWGFPDLGVGVGLRSVHFGHILTQWPEVDWFEVLSENFTDTGGRPLYVLDQIAERYPIALHGVSLSIGSTDPLNLDHLARLKSLAKRVRAHWVSDHLCWTGVLGRNTHDLLPMPYTFAVAKRTAQNIREVRDYLETPICVENVSSYAEFHASEMTGTIHQSIPLRPWKSALELRCEPISRLRFASI